MLLYALYTLKFEQFSFSGHFLEYLQYMSKVFLQVSHASHLSCENFGNAIFSKYQRLLLWI